MQKIQILFPDPVMAALRSRAEAEDRPVSELVRRAVDRHLAQLGPSRARTRPAPVFPSIRGGAVKVSAEAMKAELYRDDAR